MRISFAYLAAAVMAIPSLLLAQPTPAGGAKEATPAQAAAGTAHDVYISPARLANPTVSSITSPPATDLTITPGSSIFQFNGKAGSPATFNFRDVDGTIGGTLRQTSDANGDATWNDILQLGLNVASGGGAADTTKRAVYAQLERNFLSTGIFYSEWHINHVMVGGTIKRTLQSNVESGTGNGTISLMQSQVTQEAMTFVDNTTAASGTNGSAFAGFGISRPTLTATNASVTRTSAATLTVGGPPVAGTNTTITNGFTIRTDRGYSYFNTATDGGVYIGGTTMEANKPPFSFAVEGNSLFAAALAANNFSSSAYQIILGGGVGDNGMTIFSGTASTGNIYFADANVSNSNNRIGRIVYNHATDTLNLTAGDNGTAVISGDGLAITSNLPTFASIVSTGSNRSVYLNFTPTGSGSAIMQMAGSDMVTIGRTSKDFAFASTTEASTGVGSITTAGGIYAAKKIITASTITTAAGAAWNVGGYTAGAPTPDGYLTAVVNGTTYRISADAQP